MAGSRSRRKGARAELELAQALQDHLGIKLQRNLEQSRNRGHDLIPPPGADGHVAAALGRYAFECKRYSRATPALLRAWWAQTVTQAQQVQLIPCLAYREDRQDWQLLLPLSDVRPDLPHGEGLAWTVQLGLEAFSYMVRET
jgi:hypothetical protein